MCGIAGFSLSVGSTINPRKLANALLTIIEDRGYMASGFAYQDGDSMGWHKEATPGSQLSLKSMPKHTRNVILHTRLATHGSTKDNRNNHPVLSPDENIALVHNGVIYNHTEVRRYLDNSAGLPEVDTSVIPALLDSKGLDDINVLDGDAAIAWFDKDTPDVLHLARYQYSPLVMCQVEDGSFIFASTEALLWKALVQMELMPDWLESAKELEYYTIKNGIITSKTDLPAPAFSNSYDTGYYRHQTAGAKGSTPSSAGIFGDTDYWDEWTPANDNGYLDDEVSEEFVDEDDFHTPPSRVGYFIYLYEKMAKEYDTLFYYSDETDAWKNEVWALTTTEGVYVLDYGLVIRGELVSMNTLPEYEF